MSILNQWFYVKQPKARVSEKHYEMRSSEFLPVLSTNEVLIEAKYFSVDPYMRIQQHKSNTWDQPHPLNTVQGGAVVSKVSQSNHNDFKRGDWVSSYSGWQTHAVLHASELEKLDPTSADVKTALGVLGMPGRTAWFGLMEAGRPKAGDVLVVSGAAGAVGSLVTQFGIKNGCKVLAIAGTDEKCTWLKSLGAFTTINYKNYTTAKEIQKEIMRLTGGIDVYFDNVGGMITDAVMNSLNLRARIVICGQISQYDGGLDKPELGPRFLHHMLYKRATIQGILARDYSHRMQELHDHIKPWLLANELEFKTTLYKGFEALPHALGSLFEGQNIGKAIVEV